MQHKDEIPGQVHGVELDFIAELAAGLRPNARLVELGSLFGRSSWTWAQAKPSGATLYCIDPWRREHWICALETEFKTHFGLETFCRHTADCTNLVPLRTTSPDGLIDWVLPVDLVFDDSVHSNPVFRQNLDFWRPLLRDGGILCGHDYHPDFPDVMAEVDALAKREGAVVERAGAVWAVRVHGAGARAAEMDQAPKLMLALEEVPASFRKRSAMINREEAALCYQLARDHTDGSGAIVDLGCFLGETTRLFVEGLRSNPRITGPLTGPDKRIWSYDRFLFEPYKGYDTCFSETEVPTGSFFPLFSERIADVAAAVAVVPGDLLQLDWTGKPIDILFVDLAKNWRLNHHVVTRFFPSLRPGHSVVVQQDYFYCGAPWTIITMELLADWFVYEGAAFGSSAIFTLRRPLPRALLTVDLEHHLSLSTKLFLLNRARQRQNGCRALLIGTALVGLLIFEGHLDRALAEYKAVKAAADKAEDDGWRGALMWNLEQLGNEFRPRLAALGTPILELDGMVGPFAYCGRISVSETGEVRLCNTVADDTALKGRRLTVLEGPAEGLGGVVREHGPDRNSLVLAERAALPVGDMTACVALSEYVGLRPVDVGAGGRRLLWLEGAQAHFVQRHIPGVPGTPVRFEVDIEDAQDISIELADSNARGGALFDPATLAITAPRGAGLMPLESAQAVPHGNGVRLSITYRVAGDFIAPRLSLFSHKSQLPPGAGITVRGARVLSLKPQSFDDGSRLRLLVVSAVPTSPQDEASRHRLHHLCHALKGRNVEIHMVIGTAPEGGGMTQDTLSAMAQEWASLQVVPLPQQPDIDDGGLLLSVIRGAVDLEMLSERFHAVLVASPELNGALRLFDTLPVLRLLDASGSPSIPSEALERTDLLLTASETQAADLRHRTNRPVLVLPDHAEDRFVAPTASLLAPKAVRRVGVLSGDKGEAADLHQLIEALRVRAHRLPEDLELWVGGPAADELSLPDSRFVRRLPAVADVAAFYRSIDVCVALSGVVSTQPLGAVAALSHGVPLLGTAAALGSLPAGSALTMHHRYADMTALADGLIGLMEDGGDLPALIAASQALQWAQGRRREIALDDMIARIRAPHWMSDQQPVPVFELEDTLPDDRPIYLYGAGAGCGILLDLLSVDQRRRMVGAIDRFRHGETRFGFPVIAPEAVPEDHRRHGIFILTLTTKAWREAASELRNIGFGDVRTAFYAIRRAMRETE